MPQLTSVARMPKFRKLTNASRTIALAMIRVADTTIGPRALGRMCRNAIRRSLTPTARAAWTKSISRSDRNMARTRRAKPGHDSRPKMRIRVTTSPPPKKRAATRMTNRKGIASNRSTKRMRKPSIIPPK